MAEYNASDTRQVRAAAKASKTQAALDAAVVLRIMSDPTGRDWARRLLEHCHVFATPFTGLAATTDFNCGQQSVGLKLLGEIVNAAPDQYIQMMRESADKEQANGRRSDNDSNGFFRDRADDGRPDQGRPDDADGSVSADYNPDPDS